MYERAECYPYAGFFFDGPGSQGKSGDWQLNPYKTVCRKMQATLGLLITSVLAQNFQFQLVSESSGGTLNGRRAIALYIFFIYLYFGLLFG